MKALTIGLTLLLAGSQANAQFSGGQWRLEPQGQGRRGVEVKAPPAPVVDPGLHNPSFPRQPVAFTLVPAILMSDGSIFANFGFGYEPVVRGCSGVAVVGRARRIASNGVVLSEPTRLPYTQPVPAQQYAASQRIAAQNRQLSAPAQHSCFSRDAAGRVFVFRRI